ncbi:MAG: hypothetical protein U1F46_05830 [Marinagarivorans sp.]
MPGNSWQDRLGLRGAPTSAPDALTSPAEPAGPPTAPLPERLNVLLHQRQQLEQRMQNLVGGGGGDLREAARFQVPSFAQRLAEQRQWEAERARSRNRPEVSAPGARQPNEPQADALRSGLRDFSQPVGEWLNARDTDRRRLRDQARDRLSPLEQLAEPVRGARRQLQDANRQLRDLDQRLASEGLNEDRAALRELGADRLDTAERYLSRADDALSAPRQIVDRLDTAWQNRSNQISGAMDRFGSYVERSRQRLASETGGSGDLFARMQQNRERALLARKEQQWQERRDQARRERAQQRRREHEDTE